MLNNVPVTLQSLAASRDLINTNFSVIDTAFSVNHVQYNDGSGGQGKHNLVTFTLQSAVPAIAINEMILFEKLPAGPQPTTGVNELFLKRTTVANSEIPITASVINGSFVNAGITQNFGWSYWPSGVLCKWATCQFTSTTLPQTILFPTGANIPVFKTAPLSIMGTWLYDGVSTTENDAVNIFTITTTSFGLTARSNLETNLKFMYFAIGT